MQLKHKLIQLQSEGIIGEWSITDDDINTIKLHTSPFYKPTIDDLEKAEHKILSNKKKSQVYILRDQENQKNLIYNNNIFLMDARSQQQLMKSLIRLNAGRLKTPTTWTLANGSTIDLTANDFEKLADKIEQREEFNYSHARSLINRIESAKTIEKINAIDINSGWF